jgi:thiamine-monophosphate kinase
MEQHLSQLGEFGLIAKIRKRFPAPDGVTGIGDDCAILPQQSGRNTLVSTDMLIEGTHFLRRDISPYDLGWKSAAVNISDIAAMGGHPTATFLSLALPATITTEWTDEFLRGYAELSERFGVPLLGGDTTASPDRICINVTVLGECPSVRGALLRSGARKGDVICVTGALGDSAAGLKAILDGVKRDPDVQRLIDRHYRPTPRVPEGEQLRMALGVNAMMDLSDGLASDLQHILDASEVDAEIDVTAIPLSPALKRVCAAQGWDPVRLAVSGGEDYELLFTCTPQTERLLSVSHFVIGKVTDRARGDARITWRGARRPVAPGFDHFKK